MTAFMAFLVIWLALTTLASAQAGRNAAEQGRQVFFSQGCYGCHRLGVAGTPRLALTEDEIRALASYLASLR